MASFWACVDELLASKQTRGYFCSKRRRPLLNTKRGAAALSIASNTSLIILKLIVALAIGSVSVLSEAIHSGIDLIAAIIAFFSVGRADVPADEDHPFGHGKAESVSGLIEALLIFVAALMIVHEAWEKFNHGVELESVDLGVAVMAVSVIANFLVSRHLLKVAKQTDSIALEADARHLTTDIVTSLGVFIGLLAVRLTGLVVLDPLIALAVALLIIRTAFDLTMRSIYELMDKQLPEQELAVITNAINSHAEHFSEFHALRCRKSGSERHIDLHLVVARSITVKEAHALCDRLENEIESSLPRSKVTIHVEPCERLCEDCETTCSELTRSETVRP